MTEETPSKPRRRKLGMWVARETTTLATGGRHPDGTTHGGYVDGDPAARAAVARLARAAGHRPGMDPGILMWTIPPETVDQWDGTGVSNTEWAAFAALTLYAVHQQGNRQPMHVNDGTSLGRAVGLLCWNNPGENGVRRAFARLENTREWAAAVRHARTLIGMLSDAGIPLDYGTLADDLNSLRYGADSRKTTVMHWGRDLQRGFAAARDASEDDDTVE